MMIGLHFKFKDGSEEYFDPIIEDEDLQQTETEYVLDLPGFVHRINIADVESIRRYPLCKCGYELYEDGCKNWGDCRDILNTEIIMINLLELNTRYQDVGLGYIRFGGKAYFEINSDKPLSLNSYGGPKGFVLDEQGRVELYDLSNRIFVKRHYYEDESWDLETDTVTPYFWDEDTPASWWGLTLDNYYPHPWYPDRAIIAMELVNDIPGHRKGTVLKVYEDGVETNDVISKKYSVWECLQYPEFFKPVYV